MTVDWSISRSAENECRTVVIMDCLVKSFIKQSQLRGFAASIWFISLLLGNVFCSLVHKYPVFVYENISEGPNNQTSIMF